MLVDAEFLNEPGDILLVLDLRIEEDRLAHRGPLPETEQVVDREVVPNRFIRRVLWKNEDRQARQLVPLILGVLLLIRNDVFDRRKSSVPFDDQELAILGPDDQRLVGDESVFEERRHKLQGQMRRALEQLLELFLGAGLAGTAQSRV